MRYFSLNFILKGLKEEEISLLSLNSHMNDFLKLLRYEE
jgi:hypothetical protein